MAEIPGLSFFALSILASLFLGLGVAGLFLPGMVPFMSSPLVSWSSTGIGVVLEGAALLRIMTVAMRNATAQAD
ncbi:MAG: hypothetical protein AAF384_02360 [Pseudomonadota bacterium]